MRIVLSEGSGLTSRQTAWRLGELGHEVELLSSSRLCISRFTRHVRAVHPVPNFGSDPFGWLDAAMEIAKTRKADLLFPTQEQVTILSAQVKRLTIATIVPPFAALRRMQDKISAFRTLAEIGAPPAANGRDRQCHRSQAHPGIPRFRQTTDQHGKFWRATSQDAG